MKIDMTLLEKDKAPTIAELRAFFREHDFSAQVSKYDPWSAIKEQNALYIRAKKHFLSAWNKQMGVLTGKSSLINYSSNSPIRTLEEANEKLIAGTVMEILSDASHYENIIDSVLTSFEDNITSELEQYAAEHNKSVEELSEDEFSFVLEKFADLFLASMMEKLLMVESVPEIMGVSSQLPTHEDFSDTPNTNYDKVDFKRRWNHLRTKIGEMESFDEKVHVLPSEEKGYTRIENVEFLNMFYQYLGDDVDVMIFKMTANGYTQKEIAEHLGYKTHSAVGKRLKKIEEKRAEFLKRFGT